MNSIVFVHGLTGNRESTWTDKESGVFWPAHLLKNDIPKTRIMTFGYDADIVHFWAMASQNFVGNHALKLVNCLAQIRERTETEDRPIIFVTHSLGGLVFEDVGSNTDALNRLLTSNRLCFSLRIAQSPKFRALYQAQLVFVSSEHHIADR
jgi:hypothetical protein